VTSEVSIILFNY